MTTPRLTNLNQLPAHVHRPSYEPARHKTGIVHLGLGAFHKSHQAFYTDAALEAQGGDWRITGVSLRSQHVPEQVNAQNGLYTLLVKSQEGVSARVVSSIADAVSATNDSMLLHNSLASPDCRIVSLSVTEKGYGIDREHGGIDRLNSTIAHDLQHPEAPKGVIGYMVNALQRRRLNGVEPFTVLCCDNLPDNGSFIRQGVLDFAQRIDVELAHWISDHVAFPATMVDRITPAQTPETVALAEQLTGHLDLQAIETEPFHQWVIEDNFVNGRPDWTAAGALFTDNVAPYEAMKLRMLNGAHSMLAYAGFLTGHVFVRDVMADGSLSRLVARHMQAASKTLPGIPGFDVQGYAGQLMERFSNPAIAHETAQIATDGSQKLPQRIFEPALAAIESGASLRPFAFAAALWMYYCRGLHADRGDFVIHDPLASSLQLAARCHSVDAIVVEFSDIQGLIPRELSANANWNSEVVGVLTRLNEHGVRVTVDKEAADLQG